VTPLFAQVTAHIVLQDSPLAGFQYYAGKALWPQMQVGDALTLIREPDNSHDPGRFVSSGRPQDRLCAAPRDADVARFHGWRPGAGCPHCPGWRRCAIPGPGYVSRSCYPCSGPGQGAPMKRLIVFTLMALGWLRRRAAETCRLPVSALPRGIRDRIVWPVCQWRGRWRSASTRCFVGSMRAGRVYAIPLQGERKPLVIAGGLNLPVGVAFRDGDLYVSAVSRILRLRNIEARLKQPPGRELVSSAYPADTHHGWKFIAFGPDGKLYVPVGRRAISASPIRIVMRRSRARCGNRKSRGCRARGA